ncbi:peptidoglycan-binding protein [Haloimpatiens sp. FM7330]|uniref:peptidoglycan-binding domain-containing protein n=1 Tax=Haloimpatiens sp. FM7330 TaxID=3298610 RepID=UPI00362989F4
MKKEVNEQSSSIPILEIQKILNRFKIGDSKGNLLVENGIEETNTKVCIEKFQYVIKQEADGSVNETTWGAIKDILSKPLLKIGTDKYTETRYLQWRLNIYVDGIFGNMTRVAVMKFQNENRLNVDGVVGKATWKKLIG